MKDSMASGTGGLDKGTRKTLAISEKIKKVNYTGSHAHSHSKGGLIGALKGLQATKHFGAKPNARHDREKARAIEKASTSPKSAALDSKVNAGKGRKLTAAESAYKTRNWPTGNVDMAHEHRLMGKDS